MSYRRSLTNTPTNSRHLGTSPPLFHSLYSSRCNLSPQTTRASEAEPHIH